MMRTTVFVLLVLFCLLGVVVASTSVLGAVLYVAPFHASSEDTRRAAKKRPTGATTATTNPAAIAAGSVPLAASDLPSWAAASDFGFVLSDTLKKTTTSSTAAASAADGDGESPAPTGAADEETAQQQQQQQTLLQQQQQQPWMLGDEECSLRRPCRSIRAAVARAAPHSTIALLPGIHVCENVRVTTPLYFQGRSSAVGGFELSGASTARQQQQVVIDCHHRSRAFFFDNVPAHLENITIVNGRAEGAGAVLVVRRTEHYMEASRFVRCAFERCVGVHSPRFRRVAGAVGIFYQRPLGGRTVEFVKTSIVRNTARAATHAAGGVMISHIDVPRLNYDATPCTAYVMDGPVAGLGGATLWGVFYRQEEVPERVRHAVLAGATYETRSAVLAAEARKLNQQQQQAAATTATASTPAKAKTGIFHDEDEDDEDDDGVKRMLREEEAAIAEAEDERMFSDVDEDNLGSSSSSGKKRGGANKGEEKRQRLRRLRRTGLATFATPSGIAATVAHPLVYATRVPESLAPYYAEAQHGFHPAPAADAGGRVVHTQPTPLVWMLWCEERASWAIVSDTALTQPTPDFKNKASKTMMDPAFAIANVCKCTHNPCSAPARTAAQRLPHHFASWSNSEPGLDSLVTPRCHSPSLAAECSTIILNGVPAAQDQRLRTFVRHPTVTRFGRPLFVSSDGGPAGAKDAGEQQYLFYCGGQLEWIVSHRNDSTSAADQDAAGGSGGACERGISSSRTNALHPVEVANGAWQIWAVSEWRQPATPYRQVSITCVPAPSPTHNPPPRQQQHANSNNNNNNKGSSSTASGKPPQARPAAHATPWNNVHHMSMLQESGDALSTAASTFIAARNFFAELRHVNRMRVEDIRIDRTTHTSTGVHAAYVDHQQTLTDRALVDAVSAGASRSDFQPQTPAQLTLHHRLMRSATEQPLHCSLIQMYHSLGDALLTGPFVLLPNFMWAARPVYVHIDATTMASASSAGGGSLSVGGHQQFVWYCMSLSEWIVVDTDPRLLDPRKGDADRCFRAVSSSTTFAVSPVHAVKWALYQHSEWAPAAEGTGFRCVDGCSSFAFWLTQQPNATQNARKSSKKPNKEGGKGEGDEEEFDVETAGAAMPVGIEGVYRQVYSADTDDGDGPPTYVLTQPAASPASADFTETILFFDVTRGTWVWARRSTAHKGRIVRLYYGVRRRAPAPDGGPVGGASEPLAHSLLARHPFFVNKIQPAPARRPAVRSQPVLPPHTVSWQCVSAMPSCRRVAVIIDSTGAVASQTSPVAVASAHLAAFLSGNYTETFQLAGRPVYVLTARGLFKKGGKKKKEQSAAAAAAGELSSTADGAPLPALHRESNAAVYFCESRSRWMIGPYSQLQQQREQRSEDKPPQQQVCHGWLASQRTLSLSPTTDVVWTLMQVKNFNANNNNNNNNNADEQQQQQQQGDATDDASSRGGGGGSGWERVPASIVVTRCADPLREANPTSQPPFDTMGRPRGKDVSDSFQQCQFAGNEAGAGPHSGGVAASQAGTAAAGAVTVVHGRTWYGDDRHVVVRACNVSLNDAHATESDAAIGPQQGGTWSSRRESTPGADEGNDAVAISAGVGLTASERLKFLRRAALFRSSPPPPSLTAIAGKQKKKGSSGGSGGSATTTATIATYAANSPHLPTDLLSRNIPRMLEMSVSDPPSSTISAADFVPAATASSSRTKDLITVGSPPSPSSSSSSITTSDGTVLPGNNNNATPSASVFFLAPPSSFPTSPRQDAFEERRGRIAAETLSGSGAVNGGDPRGAASVGGIMIVGSAAKRTQVVMVDTLVSQNTGDAGGLLLSSVSASVLRSCILSGNVALRSGGGAQILDANVSMQHLLCKNNFALWRGGCAYADSHTRLWISARSEIVHNNAGREGTTFASLCQVSIAESKLHQLVGYAFMSLFLALSASDISCMHGAPSNYLGGYGCVDDPGFLTHPEVSPYTALDIVPMPGAAVTAPLAQTSIAVRLALGHNARRFHAGISPWQGPVGTGGSSTSLASSSSSSGADGDVGAAARPAPYIPQQEAAHGECGLPPSMMTARRTSGEPLTVWEWLWEPVAPDSLWIQASRAASFLAQGLLMITMLVFSYHHLWQGAPIGPNSAAGGSIFALFAAGGAGEADGGDEEDEEAQQQKQ